MTPEEAALLSYIALGLAGISLATSMITLTLVAYVFKKTGELARETINILEK